MSSILNANPQKLRDQVIAAIRAVTPEHEISIEPSTELLGGSGLLDSLSLVELCLRLEDAAAEYGFDFDWASENAMSTRSGMFRTVQSLTDAFIAQAQGRE